MVSDIAHIKPRIQLVAGILGAYVQEQFLKPLVRFVALEGVHVSFTAEFCRHNADILTVTKAILARYIGMRASTRKPPLMHMKMRRFRSEFAKEAKRFKSQRWHSKWAIIYHDIAEAEVQRLSPGEKHVCRSWSEFSKAFFVVEKA